MNISTVMASRPWVIAGWTMLHFLWVGGLIGLAAAWVRRATRRSRPEFRHAFALICLAAVSYTHLDVYKRQPLGDRRLDDVAFPMGWRTHRPCGGLGASGDATFPA